MQKNYIRITSILLSFVFSLVLIGLAFFSTTSHSTLYAGCTMEVTDTSLEMEQSVFNTQPQCSTYGGPDVGQLCYGGEFCLVGGATGPCSYNSSLTCVSASSYGCQCTSPSVTPTTWDYGSHNIGSATVDKNFTVTVPATSPALSGPVTAGGDFSCALNCTLNVAPGTSQDVKIRYTPTTFGPVSQSVSFAGLTATVSADGTYPAVSCHCICTGGDGGIIPPSGSCAVGCPSASLGTMVACYPPIPNVAPPYDIGNVPVSSSATKVFTLKNVGDAFLSGTISGFSGAFSCVSGACLSGYSNLGAGSSVTFTVRFSPTVASVQSTTLTFSGGVTPYSIVITGTGILAAPPPPVIDSFIASPPSVPQGNPTTLSWTSSNTAFCNITDTLGNSWSTRPPSGNISGIIPAGPAPRTETYTLICDNGTGNTVSQTANVAVTVPVAIIQITPSSADFGSPTIPATSQVTFTVKNVGPAGSTLSGSVTGVYLGTVYTCSPSSCSYNGLGQNASTPITITLDATAYGAGNYDTSFVFFGGGDQSIPVTAAAVDPLPADIAVIDPISGSIDFGTIPLPTTGVTQNITIQNTGEVALTGTANITGTGFSCGATCNYMNIPAGGTYTVTVTYNPPDDNGGNPHNGSVSFSGGATSPSVTLTGQAYYPVSIGSFVGPSGTNYEQVVQGGTLLLSWNNIIGTDVNCTGSFTGDNGGWTIGAKAASNGNQTVGPISNPSTYTLDCTSVYDPTGAHPVVTADILTPTVSLSATPTQVLKGKTTNIVWEAQNYADCTLTDEVSNTVGTGLSGNYTTPKITVDTTYTLNCTSLVGPSDDVTESITIKPFVPSYIPI